MNWISRLLRKDKKKKKNPVGSKDPKDLKKCDLSTQWKPDRFHCTFCKESATHDEYIANICNTCGCFHTVIMNGRVYRKIWHEEQWQYQLRYPSGNYLLYPVNGHRELSFYHEKFVDLRID